MVRCWQIPTPCYIGGRATFLLLTVQSVSDVRQREIYTTKPLVPRPSHLEVEIAIAKLGKHTLPGSNQIPVELTQAGGDTSLRSINLFILFAIKKNRLIDGRGLILYQFTRMATKTNSVALSLQANY
jgi:hypothetical protein